jgi:hypothetical protein
MKQKLTEFRNKPGLKAEDFIHPHSEQADPKGQRKEYRDIDLCHHQ